MLPAPPEQIATRSIRSGPCAKTSGSRPPTVSRIRPDELVDTGRLAEAAALADLGEGLLDVDLERLGEEGVVADRRMRVERQVVGEERQVGGEERLQAAALAPVDPQWLVPPEHPVVDDHELRPHRGRPLEQLPRRRDAAGDLADLVRAQHLQPRPPVLGEAVHLEQLVRVVDDLVTVSHRAIIATLSALGVWRSLVARSVRVGEVPEFESRHPDELRKVSICGSRCSPREDPDAPRLLRTLERRRDG